MSLFSSPRSILIACHLQLGRRVIELQDDLKLPALDMTCTSRASFNFPSAGSDRWHPMRIGFIDLNSSTVLPLCTTLPDVLS